MKKLIMKAIFLAVLFFPVVVLAAEKNVTELQRQVITNLCETNTVLADRLNQLLENGSPGTINVFFDRNGEIIEIVPTGIFFLMIKDLVARSEDVDYDGIINQLLRHNGLLEEALKNNNFRYYAAERIK